jgi:hypothetical protein
VINHPHSKTQTEQFNKEQEATEETETGVAFSGGVSNTERGA